MSISHKYFDLYTEAVMMHYLGVVLERLRIDFAVAELLDSQRQAFSVDNSVALQTYE
jgi:hypothetical protein